MGRNYVVLALLGLALAAGCGGKKSSGGKPKVAVSIFPIYDLTRRIAGDRAEVMLVLPPGKSEHGYDPTPKEIARLEGSKLAIAVGLDMDGWVEGIMKTAGDVKVVRIGDRVKTIPIDVEPIGEEEAGHDEHHDDHDKDHAQGSAAGSGTPDKHDDHDDEHDKGTAKDPGRDLAKDVAAGSAATDKHDEVRKDGERGQGGKGPAPRGGRYAPAAGSAAGSGNPDKHDDDHDDHDDHAKAAGGGSGAPDKHDDHDDHAKAAGSGSGAPDRHDDDDHDDHGHAAVGSPDPHVWMDPERMLGVVDVLVAELIAIDPAGKDVYTKNGETLKAALRDVDGKIAARSKAWTKHTIVTFHGSMAYFAKRYGVRIAAVVEPIAGKEPTASYIAEVIGAIKLSKATALFTEPQLDRGPGEMIAKEAGIPLGELDPVGGVAGRDTYESLLIWNTDQLEKVLK